jgi:hypothetical protein
MGGYPEDMLMAMITDSTGPISFEITSDTYNGNMTRPPEYNLFQDSIFSIFSIKVFSNNFFGFTIPDPSGGTFTLKITQEATSIYAKRDIIVKFEWSCKNKENIFRPEFTFTRKETTINVIDSPMDFYSRYCTLVEPIGSKWSLYDLTVGRTNVFGQYEYNIKPTIPNQIIKNAKNIFPFLYSVSDPDGVVYVDSRDDKVTFLKPGIFKVTITHEFFESEKYNVGYFKKNLGEFTVDYKQ